MWCCQSCGSIYKITAKSKDCTLIITEGDFAKSLAVSGISVVGYNKYGVFPLKGKPLNVRDQNQLKVINNKEIKNLVDILGLKFGAVYDETNIKTLRYGHLMIMTDQVSRCMEEIYLIMQGYR